MSLTNILVVEDEVIVAKNIQDKLEKLGYSVKATVTSGEEAVKKTEEMQPDLILMDIKLEGDMDGIETTKQIRKNFDIPIVYLTAFADDETLNRVKLTEPYGYIIKPFNERELQSNIEIALYKHQMENKLKERKEQLQNVINSASEVIISIDKKGRIATWNKSAEIVTGFRQREIVRKHVSKLNVFDNPEYLLDKATKKINGEKTDFHELVLRTKKNSKKIIRVSYTSVRGDNEEKRGLLIVGKDITYERESHSNLIKGNSYLVLDEFNRSSIDLFSNFTKMGYSGLFITRANIDFVKNMVSPNVDIILFNQSKLDGFKSISGLDELIGVVKEFCVKRSDPVILLDRVDYLLTMFPFEKFVETLYVINDTISENRSILLLHLHPSLLDNRQMTIIQNELQVLPGNKIAEIELDDELFDILRFVYEQNTNNLMVPFKKIRQRFNIAYSTTAIKIKALDEKGLLSIKKYGRFKTLHVTEKGKSLITKT